jgi:hypothetical protein
VLVLDHVPDADPRLLERHADWWLRRGSLYAEVAREPLGDLWLPLSDGTVAESDTYVRPEQLDLGRLAGPRLDPDGYQLDGDLFRIAQPFVRVPWVEAILGCRVRATIEGGSMRTEAFAAGWDDWAHRSVRHQPDWLATLLALTRLVIDRVGGSLAVTPTLMRGPCDLAEAVLGPELMCLSMYDRAQELRGFLAEATDVFIETLHAQLDLIAPVAGGYVNPFGIWAPGTVARTQCDASAILSPAHYREWYLPWDVRICESVDYSIIHLHSVSLHTVEPLLGASLPQAIQVTIETTRGAPSIAELVPTFRRILQSKCLVIDGQISPSEVACLRAELPQDGLCIINRQGAW